MIENQELLETGEESLGKCLGQAEDLTKEQVAQEQAFFSRYRHLCSTGDFDLGYTDKLKHGKDLEEEVPFKKRHRRIPPALYEEVRAHLQQVLDHGIIRGSNSPYASLVVSVRKKKGTLRFCVDYRLFNQKTIRDSYALPRIDELLDNLIEAKY